MCVGLTTVYHIAAVRVGGGGEFHYQDSDWLGQTLEIHGELSTDNNIKSCIAQCSRRE